jgi:hypothetical protein
VNDAVAILAALMVTLQVAPETLAHPVHEESVEPASGVAVSVTTVAGTVLGTLAVHPAVEPVVHEMPCPVTVPRPVPDVLAVRSQVAGPKLAVTVFAPVIDTVQTFPETDVQPLQLEKTDPASGVAVRVTTVAGDVFGTDAVHPTVEPVVQETP